MARLKYKWNNCWLVNYTSYHSVAAARVCEGRPVSPVSDTVLPSHALVMWFWLFIFIIVYFLCVSLWNIQTCRCSMLSFSLIPVVLIFNCHFITLRCQVGYGKKWTLNIIYVAKYKNWLVWNHCWVVVRKIFNLAPETDNNKLSEIYFSHFRHFVWQAAAIAATTTIQCSL